MGRGFVAPCAALAAAGELAGWGCVGTTLVANAVGRNGDPPQGARWARSHSRE